MTVTLLLLLFQMQPSIAERIYPISGLETRISNLPALLQMQYDQQFGDANASPAKIRAFSAMKKAFKVDSLRRDSETWFKNHIHPEFGTDVATWVTDSTTASMMRTLNEPLSQELVNAMETFFIAEDNVPTPERIQVLIKLDERMRTSEIEAMVIVNVYLSFVTVMGEFLPEEDRISDEDVPEIAHLMHMDLYEAYQGANLGRLAYLLRDVSDKDIDAFSARFATPEGMWFVDLGKTTTEHMLEEIGKRIDRNL